MNPDQPVEFVAVHAGASILMAVAGALLAGMLVLVARRLGPERERRVYAVGLMVTALIYVVFSALGAPELLAREGAGVVLFGVAAALGATRWPLLLTIGWAGHVAWDLALHPATARDGVPWWYPPLCIGFDLVVAVATLRVPKGPASR